MAGDSLGLVLLPVPLCGLWVNAAGLIDWTRDRRFKPHSPGL